MRFHSAPIVLIKSCTLLGLTYGLELTGKFADSISECPSMEGREEVPKSVHDLRPDDFKVVMGLGDSMMAGFGAKLFNMLDTQLINEYRGISFAMGGDPHSITVPSFIKHYRADLVGASRGTHLLELCHGAFCPPDDAAYRPQSDLFNAAQTGAMCSNLGMETKYMLHQVRHHRLVNITTDWKLLTVFIGTNDICQYACRADLKDGDMGTGEAFEAKLLLNLERIRERLPRTLVAIMQLPDASQAHWFASRHRRCLAAFPLLQMECPCAMLEGEDGRWEMRLLTADYNERILRVAETINRAVSVSQPDRALQDFAVTVIPFMRETDVRDDIPQHFMAKLDCFHPSNTAHKSMAMAYWHSLFLPYGERPVKLTEQMQVYCPTEEDRIII